MSISVLSVHAILNRQLAGRQASLEALNKQPHFIPMNLMVLERVLGDKLDPSKMSIAQFRAGLINFVKAKHKITLQSISGKLYNKGVEVTTSNIVSNTPAVVLSGTQVLGTLYASKTNSFSNAGAGLSGYLSSKEVTRALKRNNTGYRKGFDLGHTEIQSPGGVALATTPVSIQLNNIIEKAEEILFSDTLTATERAILENATTSMIGVRANFDIHTTYGATVEASMSKSFTDSLLALNVNIVVIQGRNENMYWANNIERAVIAQLKNILTEIHFSKSLKEEVKDRIVAVLSGKKATNSFRKVAIQKIVLKPIIVKVTTGVSKIKLPALRNLKTGNFTSLASLQVLLDSKLQEQIRKNMGNGNRRDILNYRTGRFAASAEVTSLSQSRQGMITAFYNYQKNPYQTFEPGFRQGSPRSRDPKLLIGKSIREIASTLVGNRLRAVLV